MSETQSMSSKGKKTENGETSVKGDDDEDRRKNDEEFGDKIVKKKKIGKNPLVDTSFLPDDERESKMLELKKKLIEDYNKEQEIIKSKVFIECSGFINRLTDQTLEVKYMYWDGSNVTKTIQVWIFSVVLPSDLLFR